MKNYESLIKKYEEIDKDGKIIEGKCFSLRVFIFEVWMDGWIDIIKIPALSQAYLF